MVNVKQMKVTILASAGILALAVATQAVEFHVAPDGNDSNPGTRPAPFRTIQRAADLARPGDVITVHEGLYRERINPPRGGLSNTERIVYQAAPGEKVEIKGSEVVSNWVKVQNDTWKTTLPNSFFGQFNPYSDLIRGDWFNPKDRQHHTGAVYLNDQWLAEAATLDGVLKPVEGEPLWFGRVDEADTTIWAQFKGVDPNTQRVEINVRQTVFYPDSPGNDFITVRGFAMRHAATPWAPPTAEQIGLIGTHWSKGWIIEDNEISHSVCTGITLGKYGDAWDNTSSNTAEGYVQTIERGLKNGWNKETVGHHVVRNNAISHCEQAGIVGSLGPIFSTITGNVIHDIHVRQLFTGAEMAGIKFHGAIDTLISRNRIYRANRGLWLDWMAQGTRVTQNFFHDNLGEDLFVEVNHGPFLVDNNIFLSRKTLRDWSQGGAYVHNLMAGSIEIKSVLGRATPFHKPHSTEIAGLLNILGGDDRFYNNIFAGGDGLAGYDNAKRVMWMDGNVFLNGAKPSKHEKDPLIAEQFEPALKLVERDDGVYLEHRLGAMPATGRRRPLVTTELLGRATVPDLPYVQPDDSPIRIDTDYLGTCRDNSNPTPGPFEEMSEQMMTVRVW